MAGPGVAMFDGLAAGAYRVDVTAEGCAPLDTTLQLEAGERVDVALWLRPVAATLAEVTIEAAHGSAEQVFRARRLPPVRR